MQVYLNKREIIPFALEYQFRHRSIASSLYSDPVKGAYVTFHVSENLDTLACDFGVRIKRFPLFFMQ